MDTIYRMTVVETAEVMNASINEFKDSQFTFLDNCGVIIYGVNKCLALRDYLLGLPLTMDLADSRLYVESLLNQAIGTDRAPLLTVLAYFAYEDGDKDLASQCLGDDLTQDYDLAKLLRRIVYAGWNPRMLTDMRNELHPLVKEQLEEVADKLVSEM